MWRTALILLAAVVAAAHAQAIDLSQSSFSPEQLANRTGFAQPSCNPDQNFYDYAIINGLPATVEFYVFLACQGVPVAGDVITVPAGQRSRTLPISPSMGQVRNTACSLSLEAQDPFETDPNAPRRQYAQYNTTCGGVQIDDDDACSGDEDDDCSFPDIPCQFETGTWYHSFASMALLYGIGAGLGIATVMILLLFQNRAHKNRADAAFNNGVHWQDTVEKVQTENGYVPAPKSSFGGSKNAGAKAGAGMLVEMTTFEAGSARNIDSVYEVDDTYSDF